MDQALTSAVESHVKEYCKSNFPDELLYHNLVHIEQVVDYVNEIAPREGLSDEDHEVCVLAAWFHDIGIADNFLKHELLSSEHAEAFLRDHHYPESRIAKVKSAIMATKISNTPKGKLDFVLRDADSLHLGKLDFFVRMMALREEMRLRLAAEVSEQDILKESILFYRGHKYHTNYAKSTYGSLKSDNLHRLEMMYQKYFGELEAEAQRLDPKTSQQGISR
jgi:predicted metal-dependent HD superfamily phosphohydrolase